MKAEDTWSDVAPKQKADILLIDTKRAETDTERKKLRKPGLGMYSSLVCFNGLGRTTAAGSYTMIFATEDIVR